MSDTPIEFVVLRKVQLQGGKIGVGIVPLASYTTPEDYSHESFFDDKRSFIVGGIYSTPNHSLNDEGKIATLSVKGSTYRRKAEGDFTAAKINEEELIAKDRNSKLEKRLKSEPVLKAEVDAIAAMIRRLPRAQRYAAISVVSGVISERVFTI